MSSDVPDDDDHEAFARKWPDELLDELARLPPELQAEHDRLLAEHLATFGPPVRLPPDLEKIEGKIASVRNLRGIGLDVPLYMFDRYEAITTVRGGMGLVIKARDPQLDRFVAIKLWMKPGPDAQANLLEEAKTLARLKHSNVVTVHEVREWNGRVFFVMEWIEGVDGHEWMKRPRSWREVRRVFLAAGEGLAAAHEAGIHHRDFKPSNILIGDDKRVVVADFGVAASLHSSPERDELGRRAGTPSYMAPERIRHKRGDARSDQFSFCAAMWRGLFGQRPFAGETSEELVGAIERGEFQEASGVDVPRWLVEVVRKGLAYDPGERHRDMRSLLAALNDEPPDDAADDDKLDDDDVAVVDGRVLHKPSEAASQRERWPYVAIGFLLALVLVMGLALLKRSPAPELPPVAESVELAPYHAILGLIAADEFREARLHWLVHESELTDGESLKIAENCLTRAQQLAPVDRTRADEAVLMALDLANTVRQFGQSSEARETGGRLVSDAKALMKSWPPG